MKIEITSPPDREALVAELWWGDEMWGEVNQEAGALMIELYPRASGQVWRFPLADFLEVLRKAGAQLLGKAAPLDGEVPSEPI